MQRLTISLDDDLAEALDSLQAGSGDSKATVVRHALRDYVKRREVGERPNEQELQIWIGLLANREHVILDVAHLRLLFEQCMQAPPEFWAELREIGIEHGRQYQDKGLKRVQDMLDIMQAANWFFVSPETDRSWTLVFTEPSSKPFVKAFLEGFYSQYPVEVDLIEERTKLRIRISSASPVGPRASR